MARFPFNFTLSQTDVENPVLTDANTYPVAQNEIQLPDAGSNSVEANSLLRFLLIGSGQTTGVEASKLIKFNAGANTGIWNIIDSYVSTDQLFKMFRASGVDATVDATSRDISYFSNAGDESTQLTGRVYDRTIHAHNLYITAKPSAGDVVVELVEYDALTGSEFTWNTDDGGWHIIESYMVKIWMNPANGFIRNYKIGEVTWNYVDDEVLYYRSLVNDNSALLSDDTKWEAFQLTQASLAAAYLLQDLDADDLIHYYAANVFLNKKLNTLVSEIWVRSGCNCSDPCKFPNELKLSMMQQQIYALIDVKNYSKAQQVYEVALELAQNISQ